LKRKFLTNLFLLITLNVLVKPFWLLGIDRSVQNVVGAQEYGFYFSLFNFSIILNIFLDMGITNFNNREIARHKHMVVKYLSNLITARFFLGLIYLLISIFAAWLIGYKWYQMNLLLFLLLNQFMNSFILYLRSNINGMHLFKTDSILSVLDRLLLIMICSVLLWGNVTQTPFKIEWLVYAQSFSYFLALIIVLVIILLRAGIIKPRFDRLQILYFLKQSIPFALLGLLMSLYTRIDTVMLERLLPDGKMQAGIYAQAFRLLDAGSMAGYLFAVLLLPMFSRMLQNNEDVGQLLRFSFILIILPTLSLAIASVFHKYSVMNLLYHHHVDESGSVFGILMFSLVFVSSGYIFGTLLTANGNLRQLNIISGISLVFNVVLNFALIPRYQAQGSAIASLVSLGLVSVLQVVTLKKVMSEKLEMRFGKLTIFAAGLLLSGYMLEFIPVHWFLRFSALFILAFLFSYTLNLISLKKLKEAFHASNFKSRQ